MTEETKAALKALELFSARHPRPVHVTITQAAEMLGLSRRTVGKMVKCGQIRLNKCGLIPVEQIDAAIEAR